MSTANATTETRINYTTINHDARIRLGLSWHEYGLADLIYNLGNNPKSPYRGWCYAKKEFLASQLGISRRAVTTMIAKLLDKGLIEKHPETKHLRITIDWYQEVLIKSSEREQTSHSEKNLLTQREETSHRGEKKLPTTKILNKDIYRNSSETSPNGKSRQVEKDKKKENSRCPLLLKEKYPSLVEKYPNGHQECTEFISSIEQEFKDDRKFVNYGKQLGALHKILRAGYTFEQINSCIVRMDETDFWKDKGWDFADVANVIGKGGKQYG